jgi:hypothetical protein
LNSHEQQALSINQKLAKIQQQLKAPKSLGGGDKIKFKYRNCEQILELLKPLLEDLTIIVSDEMIGVGDRVYVKATARLSDGVVAISSSAYAREPADSQFMSQPQMSGAISSYARKYALCGLFAIDGGAEDPDSIDMEGNRDTPIKKKILGEMCTQQQKDDILVLGGDYENICKYFKTDALTMGQAAMVIASLKRKQGAK